MLRPSHSPRLAVQAAILPALVLTALFSGCQARATVPPAAPLSAAQAAPPPAQAAVVSPQAAVRPMGVDTFDDVKAVFKEITSLAPAPAQARADELWQTLVARGRVPWTDGTKVVFFYKGQAEQVNWRGSFNAWGEPGLAGARVGQTDLWIAYTEFPEASRAEYKIVLNGEDWVVDPANPNTAFSGLNGANNVVTLPGFSVSDESKKRAEVTPGALTGDLTLNSQALGYAVNYRVYMPAGYEGLARLPVIYVLDGNDFGDERMGALPNVLDNLIADGRIAPALAVFIDSREPGNPQRNRREDEFLVRPVEHARFVAGELVPVVDGAYRTDPRPDARVIMGVSYGGLSAYYLAASQSAVFHNLAAFSPSLWVLDSPQYVTDQKQLEGSRQMLPAVSGPAIACGGDTGYTCPRLPVKIFLSAGLATWDVGDFRNLAETLDQQGYPLEFHQVREGHTWDNWRGLTDEMLLYFFGKD